MGSPWRNAGSPLTQGQKDQLRLLYGAGAISRETAKGPYVERMRGCNPNIIGALRNKGLADSRTIRAGAGGNKGGQYTAYWITEAGLPIARELVG